MYTNIFVFFIFFVNNKTTFWGYIYYLRKFSGEPHPLVKNRVSKMLLKTASNRLGGILRSNNLWPRDVNTSHVRGYLSARPKSPITFDVHLRVSHQRLIHPDRSKTPASRFTHAVLCRKLFLYAQFATRLQISTYVIVLRFTEVTVGLHITVILLSIYINREK